jgi:ABC-type transporter MlaC component
MSLPVAFRVAEEDGGKFAVVDASVAGIWLGLAQRADFGGYLSQHSDSVPMLTEHLKDITAKLAAPIPASAAR